jgi:hypothetical protein
MRKVSRKLLRSGGADPLVCSWSPGRLLAPVHEGRRGRRPRTRGSAPLIHGLLILACFACPLTLPAADLAGIWVGQIPGRNGDLQDVAFKFTQTGATLGGKLYGDYQSTPISEGKISGDQITFLVIAPEQAGNQINQARLRFTGTIQAGEIELTREREGATNAGNGGSVQFRGNTKQTFRLKRLL